ncbi:hypothetical protein FRC11_010139 [Ceratobasidium sp. 423]|nr:hypothetical protein FRC11_010139 [Ceratobasidium sp. 423]
MSAWGISNVSEASGVPEQQRVQYRGEPFADCYVNGAGLEYDRTERTQTITTSMTFSWEMHSHFVGQYYGPGQGMQKFIQHASASDYRKLVLAALEVISVDSLSIVQGQHLSNPALNIKIYFLGDPDTGDLKPSSISWTYLNGTQLDKYPREANIYGPTLLNLLVVATDAVSLDLGSRRHSTIFTNISRIHDKINPNPAPPGINASDWADGTKSFNYEQIVPPYQTWAEMLLNDQPFKLGNATGMPDKSVMATTYLCPIYQVKSPGSLVTLVFVGIASMLMSIWTVWTECKKRKEKAEGFQGEGGKEEQQVGNGVVDGESRSSLLGTELDLVSRPSISLELDNEIQGDGRLSGIALPNIARNHAEP